MDYLVSSVDIPDKAALTIFICLGDRVSVGFESGVFKGVQGEGRVESGEPKRSLAIRMVEGGQVFQGGQMSGSGCVVGKGRQRSGG